jgi:tripeptide aminopeptidase
MNQLPVGLIDYVVAQIRTIYTIPAPTFSEDKRAEYVVREMEALGLQQALIDPTGNALACWPGGSEKPLVISAHLDTVHTETEISPIVETADGLCGPGIGDNSLGVAALLGLGKALVDQRLRYQGDIWLVGNVCEEGLGNLAGMKAIADRFGEDARAYLILEGLGLGQVCHRGLGVARFKITAETSGGHSWVDYGRPSAIHEIAGVITSLAESTIPRKPRSSLNIGVIQGGTSINTIAAQAWCELDLRSEDQITLAKLIKRVRRIIASKERLGVKIAMESIGSRPAGGSNLRIHWLNWL